MAAHRICIAENGRHRHCRHYRRHEKQIYTPSYKHANTHEFKHWHQQQYHPLLICNIRRIFHIYTVLYIYITRKNRHIRTKRSNTRLKS